MAYDYNPIILAFADFPKLFNATSVREALQAGHTNQNIMIFTIVTIFYLPLSFVTVRWLKISRTELSYDLLTANEKLGILQYGQRPLWHLSGHHNQAVHRCGKCGINLDISHRFCRSAMVPNEENQHSCPCKAQIC